MHKSFISDAFTGIVYTSCVDWDSHWERMHQFAWMLAKEMPILYVDNPGVRPLRWEHLPRIFTRISRAIQPGGTRDGRNRRSNPLAEDVPGLHILAPLLAPSPTNRLLMSINRVLFNTQINRAISRTELNKGSLFWTSCPTDPIIGLLNSRKWDTVVYDCVNDHAALHPYRAKQLQKAEDVLLEKADIVIVTSRALERKMLSRGRSVVHYVPNAVDLERFSRKQDIPEAMLSLPRPILGFLGSMLPCHFDMDLIISLADKHPEWSIVLIGPMDPTLSAKAQGTPLHLIGSVGFDEVPSYLKSFDVGLIPYLESEAVRAVNPLKVYEYFAAGLPVVSVPLPELSIFEDLITQVSGVDNFSGAITAALAEGKEHSALRQQVVQEHSWEHRLAKIDSILRQYVSD